MNAIANSKYNKNQKIGLIGRESLSIRDASVRASANSSTVSVFRLSKPSPFNARVELQRLMKSPVAYSPAELADAEAALARIETSEPLDINQWADDLSEDLSKFND